MRALATLPRVLLLGALIRAGLIVYSEWHDAHSVVKYTDVDYRVVADAARFLAHPAPPHNAAQGPLGRLLGIGDPYARATYRYTPLLAVLLVPNEYLGAAFGKVLFAACDLAAGALIYRLLLPSPSPQSKLKSKVSCSPQSAALLSALHVLSPLTISISTRGSSEPALLLLVLLALGAALNARWRAAAALVGLAAHWKIYPAVYGVACVAVLAREAATVRRGVRAVTEFAVLSAGTFFALGGAMYAIWGHPFLDAAFLYHLRRVDHRHNFAPHFYAAYLASSPDSPAAASPFMRALAGFVPQLGLAIAAGLLLGRSRGTLPLAWCVQSAAFVLFNRVCTSQYFLWYTLFAPLLAPRLRMTRARGAACAGVWAGAQALWLSQAYRLEFLGEPVFLRIWVAGGAYVLGHAWVLGEVLDAYEG